MIDSAEARTKSLLLLHTGIIQSDTFRSIMHLTNASEINSFNIISFFNSSILQS